MSPRDPVPDLPEFRRAWSSSVRTRAAQQIRDVLNEATELVPAAEAVAEAMTEIMRAKFVTVTLLDEGVYWELVNVGDIAEGEVRLPDERYPTSWYPVATRRLLTDRGYISRDGTLDLGNDHPHRSAWTGVGCFMGVPIVAVGEVRGELLIARGVTAPVFVQEDLQIATDLATPFGSRLPDLLN